MVKKEFILSSDPTLHCSHIVLEILNETDMSSKEGRRMMGLRTEIRPNHLTVFVECLSCQEIL